jgi:fructokinase
MPAVYAIGETIYDIIFRDGHPVAARPGGSMLNTAVSLGRLGMPVTFISEYAYDGPGNLIHDFLAANKVDTSSVYRYRDGKTAVALAFLDKDNNASYSFYKIFPAERLKIKEQFPFGEQDVVIFGAFFSLMPEVRPQLLGFLEKAAADALVLYDPNIRKPHRKQVRDMQELIFQNIRMSDMVRGSDEDFGTIFGIKSSAEACELVREHGCELLVYTTSGEYVDVFHPEWQFRLPVPEVNVLSTIGAGDSFNAGLVYALRKAGLGKKKLLSAGKNEWEEMIRIAIACGSHACTHYDNYISDAFAASLAAG